eukprot:scaffold1803_cov195-Alexandrium_tamarense.AAC.41
MMRKQQCPSLEVNAPTSESDTVYPTNSLSKLSQSTLRRTVRRLIWLLVSPSVFWWKRLEGSFAGGRCERRHSIS